jgi:hypothetical protein
MLSLITEHGRATPLIWLTVDKKTLNLNPAVGASNGQRAGKNFNLWL